MTQTITITNQVEHYTCILAQAIQFDYERFVIQTHKDAIERGEAVDYHTQRLQEIKESRSFSNSTIFPVISTDTHYRIEQHPPMGQKSIVAFIDKTTADVFKPESWDTPQSTSQYNLLDETSREECIRNATWTGDFLQ